MFLNRNITATVYIFNENKVLLHMHKKYKSLFPIGGHMEKDELPIETARREIQEETGLTDIEWFDAAPDLELQRGQMITPYFLLHENIGKEDDEIIDMIFAAKTHCWNLKPDKNESKEFYWMAKEEIEQANDIKPHIRNVALKLFQILKI